MNVLQQQMDKYSILIVVYKNKTKITSLWASVIVDDAKKNVFLDVY